MSRALPRPHLRSEPRSVDSGAMTDTDRLVSEVQAGLRPLETALNEAWWSSSTEATEANERLRTEAEVAVSDHLARPATFAAVRAARDAGSADPLLERQLDILHDTFVPHQISGEERRRLVELQVSIESTFATHRGVISGETVDDNAIRRVLRSSDDPEERREAWEASKSVGAEVAVRVRELARLRNRRARSLGYRDHFAMSLATDELDEKMLFDTLDDVDRATSHPFAQWKGELDGLLSARFGCSADDLRPHHYEDPFFQDPPVATGVDLDEWFVAADLGELTRRTFDGIGLEVGAILDRSDLYPRSSKNQHAFCIDVDRSGDVRVLCNVVPNTQWAETMLHELGHGVYFDAVDRSLPWLLRDMHSLSTEGIAIMFGGLVHDPEWLAAVAGVPRREVGRIHSRLDAAHRSAVLVFARWALVMTHFERGLYADPDADHDTRWWDLVERFQLVHRPDRCAPDWAAKIHLAVAPVYYQSYLYGQMVASQWRATLRSECGGVVDRPEVGRILVERYFRPGASLRWDHLTEQATGSPLSPAAMIAELTG